MNIEFQDCLKRGKIREFSRGKTLSKKELQSAISDLESAKHSFKNKNYKWTTIQCYYSMFHVARALLYLKNFREKSHHCLIVAVKALYVANRLLPANLVENLQKAKTLRENADYYDEWSREGAEILLRSSEKFITACKKIIPK